MLKLQNVTVTYPDKTRAINNVSFTLNNGESVALIGANGAGKTSLLLAVAGILDLMGGTIEVDGLPLNKKTVGEIRKRVGFVFQNPDDQLFMPFIFDNVAFGCRNLGFSEEKVKERAEETLQKLNILHLCDRSSLKLSGGEKRLCAIATVLAMEPSILMFDEPTAFLDPKSRRSLIETFKSFDKNQTKIIATHDIAFAAEVCDRVILIKDGCLTADGSTDLLYCEDIMQDNDLEKIQFL